MAQVLPEKSPLGNQARVVANEIMNTFKGRVENLPQCRQLARQVLGKDWEAMYEVETGQKPVQENGNLWAIGYCHIDTAW